MLELVPMDSESVVLVSFRIDSLILKFYFLQVAQIENLL